MAMNRQHHTTCAILCTILCLLLAVVVGSEKTTTTSCNAGETAEQCVQLQEEGERTVRWRPEAEHRCSIRRVTLEQLQFRRLPPLYPEPIIIVPGNGSHYNSKKKAQFRNMTSQAGIVEALPSNFEVTLSSSNSFSAHRRTIPLTQYLDEMMLNGGETMPDELSNETWYLFGETYSQEWKDHVLQHYELPPCQTCTDDLVALSFGIGNRGSGVQWHVHGPGFAEALWGRKHWILYPADAKPKFHPDQTSRNWMEYTYPDLKELPYECTLNPGDLIYFPNMWWHATINLDPYTSFISTFTTEHNVFQ